MAQKRVFFAADDKLLNVLGDPLRKAGLTIDTFRTAAELVAAVKAAPPDALLIGARLSDGTALAAFESLAGGVQPPTVVVLASTQLAARPAYLRAGIADIAVSPIRPRQLAGRLAELAGGARRPDVRETAVLQGTLALGGRTLPVTTLDLSRDGLGFVSPEELAPNALVSVALESPDGGASLTVYGRVLQSRAADGAFHVGLRLLGLSGEEEASLLRMPAAALAAAALPAAPPPAFDPPESTPPLRRAAVEPASAEASRLAAAPPDAAADTLTPPPESSVDDLPTPTEAAAPAPADEFQTPSEAAPDELETPRELPVAPPPPVEEAEAEPIDEPAPAAEAEPIDEPAAEAAPPPPPEDDAPTPPPPPDDDALHDEPPAADASGDQPPKNPFEEAAWTASSIVDAVESAPAAVPPLPPGPADDWADAAPPDAALPKVSDPPWGTGEFLDAVGRVSDDAAPAPAHEPGEEVAQVPTTPPPPVDESASDESASDESGAPESPASAEAVPSVPFDLPTSSETDVPADLAISAALPNMAEVLEKTPPPATPLPPLDGVRAAPAKRSGSPFKLVAAVALIAVAGGAYAVFGRAKTPPAPAPIAAPSPVIAPVQVVEVPARLPVIVLAPGLRADAVPVARLTAQLRAQGAGRADIIDSAGVTIGALDVAGERLDLPPSALPSTPDLAPPPNAPATPAVAPAPAGPPKAAPAPVAPPAAPPPAPAPDPAPAAPATP